MGFTKNTPGHVIYSESGVLPLQSQVEFLTIKDILKCISTNNHNLNIIKKYLEHTSRFKKEKSFLQKIVNKFREDITEAYTSTDPMSYLQPLKGKIWDEWSQDFNKIGTQKGKRYIEFNVSPRRAAWKMNKKFNNREAKMINRFRAGFAIKLENEGYICQICNSKNNIYHKVFDCIKYSSNREQFSILVQRPFNNINQWNLQDYKKIMNFFKVNKIVY